jgi:hypothetical protein
MKIDYRSTVAPLNTCGIKPKQMKYKIIFLGEHLYTGNSALNKTEERYILYRHSPNPGTDRETWVRSFPVPKCKAQSLIYIGR